MCASVHSLRLLIVVDCGHPGTPSNGSSDFISTILDATVMHSCDSGYVLCDGDENRTCQPNMLWSGILPDCISRLLYFLAYNNDACIFGRGNSYSER